MSRRDRMSAEQYKEYSELRFIANQVWPDDWYHFSAKNSACRGLKISCRGAVYDYLDSCSGEV